MDNQPLPIKKTSRMPNVKIGAYHFSQLYPQWEEILDYFETAIYHEINSEITPRKYLADPQRFLNFFTEHIKSNPQLNVSVNQIQDIHEYVHDEFFGLGILRPWLSDPQVEDVYLNSYEYIYIVKGGKKYGSESPFESDEHVIQWLRLMLSKIGKTISEYQPIENAQLADGSRMVCLISPVVKSPGFVIRKHKTETFNKKTYMNSGVAPPEFFEQLNFYIKERFNIIIAGATGSGKTTLINFAASLIDPTERILVVEDTPELQIPHPGVYAMAAQVKGARETRKEDIDAITIRDLVRSTLRMRPDRIIIGEVRGSEAFNMLEAMNTGHKGGMATIHAASPSFTISRLEAMAAPANPNVPLWSLQNLIGSTIDIIIQMSYYPGDGRRVITEVSQVLHPWQVFNQEDLTDSSIQELVPDRIYLKTLWLWNQATENLDFHSDPMPLRGQYF